MAQSPELRERTSCATDAQVAVDGSLAVGARAQAIANLTNCPETGPGVLSRMWRERTIDPALLGTLSGISGVLRDERLLAASGDATSDEAARFQSWTAVVHHS